ncbi:MAG: DUF2059 domain-containing protein [Methylobacteriaceae bacterium]|jgi:hypothetical protein|nr:DUF2059 domain-containing protein [Methylobacteriaceae bacterium]
MRSLKSCVLAGLLAASMSAAAFAQETPPPSPKDAKAMEQALKGLSETQVALGKDTAVAMGFKLQYQGLMEQLTKSMFESGQKTSPEVLPALTQILTNLQPEMDILREQMVATTGRIFALYIPESDLKEINAFFKSPTGRLYVATQPEILKALAPAMDAWASKASEYVDTRLRAELSQAGGYVVIATPTPPPGADPAAAASPTPPPVQYTAEQLELGRRVAEDSGLGRGYENVVAQVVFGTRERLVRELSAGGATNAVEAVDSALAIMKPELVRLDNQIVDETARILLQKMPEDKLKELDTFLEAGPGKVYVDKQPQIVDAIVPAMDAWLKKAIQYINTRTRGELAKLGHHFQ